MSGALFLGDDLAAGRGVGTAIFFLILVGCLYFVPTMNAYQRRHPSREAIGVLNFLTGWTFMGWVIAMVWSCNAAAKVAVPVAQTAPQLDVGPAPPAMAMRDCPHCFSSVPQAASICRVCLRSLVAEA